MKITLLTGKTFDIENAFDFPLKVNASFKIRRLNLRIDHKKRIVVLSMPKLYSHKKALDFINAHIDWIEEKLAALPAIKDFEDGKTISLFGQQITIFYNSNSGAPNLKGNILYVGGQKEFLHRRVKDYIKREAKTVFYQKSKILADTLGCRLTGVSIKDTKSRWGSCSTLKHINYNWRIALAPLPVIDYLIAHETAHLKHQDHSVTFWKTVEDLCPAYQESQKWLKEHGNDLYLYR